MGLINPSMKQTESIKCNMIHEDLSSVIDRKIQQSIEKEKEDEWMKIINKLCGKRFPT
jgi:uncharacterized protein YqeY